jgi:hypothetical protein
VGKRERASPLGKGGDRRLGELETLLTPRVTRKRDGTAARCRASPVTAAPVLKEREVNFQTPIWSSEICPSVVQPVARTRATWGDQSNRRHRQNFKK